MLLSFPIIYYDLEKNIVNDMNLHVLAGLIFSFFFGVCN